MAVTTSRKKFNRIGIFISIIIMICILIIAIGQFKKENYVDSFILGMIFISFILNYVYFVFGIMRAKKKINRDSKKIKMENPYIYFRELPNNYGVGIATVLFNSTIENEKDIIAVILNLCAKGYLSLTKDDNGIYTVTVLKLIDRELLSNERYIMEKIINGDINILNYEKWLDCCINDGIELGLFVKNDKNFIDITPKNKFTTDQLYIMVSVILAILISLLEVVLYIRFFPFTWNIYAFPLEILLFLFLLLILVNLLLVLLLLIIPFLAITLALENYSYSYNSIISGHLKLTELGKNETQKLYSFKAFIDDFGNFASKNPEEIVLWDYYLGYAQVFGLTDKILETGYDKIIKNGSFQVEDINSISLNKLNVIQK